MLTFCIIQLGVSSTSYIRQTNVGRLLEHQRQRFYMYQPYNCLLILVQRNHADWVSQNVHIAAPHVSK